jgi:hypothetical protein
MNKDIINKCINDIIGRQKNSVGNYVIDPVTLIYFAEHIANIARNEALEEAAVLCDDLNNYFTNSC